MDNSLALNSSADDTRCRNTYRDTKEILDSIEQAIAKFKDGIREVLEDFVNGKVIVDEEVNS